MGRAGGHEQHERSAAILQPGHVDGRAITIRAVALMGRIEVVVPEGIEVELTGVPIMGANSLKVRVVPTLPGSPLVRVRALALMGDVTVRSRRGQG